MSLTIKDASNKQLKRMEKSIQNNSVFYAIVKIMAVKRKIKNKYIIKKYLNKNILEKDKKNFFGFVADIKTKIKEKFIKQRKFFHKKGINRDMRHLILNGKFIKKRNNIVDNNIDNITKAANTLYDFFKKPYLKIDKKYRNNFISFKLKEIEIKSKNKKDINLCFNYKDICIK